MDLPADEEKTDRLDLGNVVSGIRPVAHVFLAIRHILEVSLSLVAVFALDVDVRYAENVFVVRWGDGGEASLICLALYFPCVSGERAVLMML